MKQPSTGQSSQQNSFPDFPYSPFVLSGFFYSKRSDEFVIAIGKRKRIIYFKTKQVNAFTKWLRAHRVFDLKKSLKARGINTNI